MITGSARGILPAALLVAALSLTGCAMGASSTSSNRPSPADAASSTVPEDTASAAAPAASSGACPAGFVDSLASTKTAGITYKESSAAELAFPGTLSNAAQGCYISAAAESSGATVSSTVGYLPGGTADKQSAIAALTQAGYKKVGSGTETAYAKGDSMTDYWVITAADTSTLPFGGSLGDTFRAGTLIVVHNAST